MDKKKILILLIIIMIIILVCLILKINKIQNSNKSNNQVVQENIKKEEQPIDKKVVDSYEEYYLVVNAIQKYIIYNSMEKNEATYALLDKNYIAQNNITIENVNQKLKKIDKKELLVKEMYFEEGNNYNKKYYVDAYIYEYNENEYNTSYKGDIVRNYEEFNICVLVDKFNSTFSVIPQE